MGRVPAEGRTPLRGYARDVGLAFQIADDLHRPCGRRGEGRQAGRQGSAAGKETFVSLLGPERARQQARFLVDQAIEHLAGHGAEADLLRALARFASSGTGTVWGQQANASASIPAHSIRSPSAIWTSSAAAPIWSTGW